MSGNKPKRSKTRNRANQSSQGQPPTPSKSSQRNRPIDGSGKGAPKSERKDLKGSTLLMILVPFLLACAGFAWYVLQPTDQPDLTDPDSSIASQDNSQQKSAGVDTGAGKARSTNDAATSGRVWKTVEDQENVWYSLDNAATDGWDTEVAADQVTSQLNQIKKTLASSKSLDAKAIGHLVTDELAVYPIQPTELITAFSNEHLTVLRGNSVYAEDGQPLEMPGPMLGQGAGVLADELAKFAEPFVDRENLRLKLKVFRVEKNSSTITTHQTLEALGATSDGLREVNAVWKCDWTTDAKPRMKSIRLTRYESCDLDDQPMFSDCTESVLGANQSFQEQLLRGYPHWLNRQQVHNTFLLLANNGIAVGDVNGDGLEDVYLCQESGLPNLLFLQQKDGTLKDATRESGVDWLQNCSTALIADLNNDGHQDIAVAMSPNLILAMGDSSGTFQVQKAIECKDEIWSLSATDYDLDGLLDIHVGAYSKQGTGTTAANVVLTESLEGFDDGGLNILLHNDSNAEKFEFSDVTESSGLMVNNRRRTYSVGWEDYDKDGDFDMYVGNDFGWNNFYRNDMAEDGTVRFVDIAEPADARDDSFGMSVNWGDYDRDGWMDLYVSNMYSYAGNRITFQDQFKAKDDGVKKRFQRYARGNTLLRNTGVSTKDGENEIVKFEDRSMEAAVNMGRWAWCSLFLDVNNDGWEDLFVNNGYITASDAGDL